jgi:hypothetical protein
VFHHQLYFFLDGAAIPLVGVALVGSGCSEASAEFSRVTLLSVCFCWQRGVPAAFQSIKDFRKKSKFTLSILEDRRWLSMDLHCILLSHAYVHIALPLRSDSAQQPYGDG